MHCPYDLVKKRGNGQASVSVKNVRGEELPGAKEMYRKKLLPGLESWGRRHQNHRRSDNINLFTLLCSLMQPQGMNGI